MEQPSLIVQQMESLAKRYRKNWTASEITDLAVETSKSLKYVPKDRIEELFEAAFQEYQYYPTDKQILATWKKIKHKGQEQAGYYDCFGSWVPDGLFYTVLTCPQIEWELLAGDRAKILRKKFLKNELSEEEKNEWMEISKKRVRPKRGEIQKPKWEWSADDQLFHERFLESIEFENYQPTSIPG